MFFQLFSDLYILNDTLIKYYANLNRSKLFLSWFLI